MKQESENLTLESPETVANVESRAVGSSDWLGSVVLWRKIAKRAWHEASLESDVMGKKIIEAKAMCYQNCATELEALIASEVHTSPTPLKYQTSTRPLG